MATAVRVEAAVPGRRIAGTAEHPVDLDLPLGPVTLRRRPSNPSHSTNTSAAARSTSWHVHEVRFGSGSPTLGLFTGLEALQFALAGFTPLQFV